MYKVNVVVTPTKKKRLGCHKLPTWLVDYADYLPHCSLYSSLFMFRYHKDRSKKLNVDVCESHAWFIFNLHTRISLYLQIIHCNIYKISNISTQPYPCSSMGTPLYLLGEPASLLVVTNTHPPLSLVCQQLPHPLLCPSPQFKIHYLHRRHQQSQLSSSRTVHA
jgi:hypothetical protein